jgi:hypothetical protein
MNGQIIDTLLTLDELRACGLLLENDVAPAPDISDGSEHHNESLTYFDHEYGGFTKLLTKESGILNVGVNIPLKIVIQDVDDSVVDSALFLPLMGIRVFVFQLGDYNLSGVVDGSDYVIWRSNSMRNPPLTNAKVTDGDGNGDGLVTMIDFDIWRANYGRTGNGNFSADFNRSGSVGTDDYVIWRDNLGLATCASRFEGDADGDGT